MVIINRVSVLSVTGTVCLAEHQIFKTADIIFSSVLQTIHKFPTLIFESPFFFFKLLVATWTAKAESELLVSVSYRVVVVIL